MTFVVTQVDGAFHFDILRLKEDINVRPGGVGL